MVYIFELISANNHQIVMRPKYDVNELLKHLWFTSDDFLKNFWSPDENISEFHDIFHQVIEKFSKIHQK